MEEIIRSIGRGFSSLFFPTCCPICDTRVEREPLCCSRCGRRLHDSYEAVERLPSIERLHAAFVLDAPVRELVHRAKYRAHRAAARLLGLAMACRLASGRRRPGRTLFVPIPLHPTRLRERGFNQATRLARTVQGECGGRVRDDLLVRVRWEGSQTSRVVAARQASVRGAFRCPKPVPEGPILLVDDVWTTGATVEAAREALTIAGVDPSIEAVVAARTPSRNPH